jgi:hypothetical protein
MMLRRKYYESMNMIKLCDFLFSSIMLSLNLLWLQLNHQALAEYQTYFYSRVLLVSE